MISYASRISRVIFALIVIMMLANAAVWAQDSQVELAGTVTYPDGSPAVGAKVTYCTLNSCSHTAITTDESGQFRISAKPGRYFFDATLGDYLASGQGYISEDGKVTTRPDMKLQYACLVLGEVTDLKTCQAIEGAKACVYGTRADETTSSNQGTFKLRALPVDGLELTVSKAGYVTQRMNFSAQGQDTVGWRVRLKPAGVVRGTVVDQHGQPVAGIGVSITEDGVYSRSVKTDQNGHYEMGDVDPDIPAQMRIEDKRISTSTTSCFEFPKGSLEATGDFKVDLAGKELRTITGLVTDTNGSPVPGATVTYGRSTCEWNASKTNTDDTGSYTLSGLTPEPDLILVQADGFAPEFVSVESTGNDTLDAVLQKAHSAQLQVVGPHGEPLSGISVTVCVRTPMLGRFYGDYCRDCDVYRWLYNAMNDEEGRVTLGNIPAKNTLVEVYKAGYVAQMYSPIRADSTDNIIQMQGTPQVAGTVVDADTGLPIRCFTVKWREPGSFRMGGDANTTFNKSDGKFLTQVGDNRRSEVTKYEVKVLANGYVGEVQTLDSTNAPIADYSNVYRLCKSFATKGIVIDSNGKAIPCARITFVETGGYHDFTIPPQVAATAYRQETTSGACGEFVVDPVFEKTATVIVEKDGYPKQIFQGIDLTKPITVTLPIPATVKIKATTFGAAGGKVIFTSVKGSFSASKPPENLPDGGECVYSNIEPGKYLIFVSGKRLSYMCPVTLEPGKTTVLDLDKPEPVIVSGTVTRLGAPVADAEVRVGNYDDYSACTTDSDGRYSVTTHKTGEVTITCYQAWPNQQVVKLKSGKNAANLIVPGGTVTGRLIDSDTGNPIAQKKISLMGSDTHTGRSDSYFAPYMSYSNPNSLAMATTDTDGSFVFNNIPSGKLTFAVGEPYRWESIGASFEMAENGQLEGITVSMNQPGVIDLDVIDSESGLPVERTIIGLVTPDGIEVKWGNLVGPTKVPSGKYRLWAESFDSRHFTTYADIEVKPDQTAKVTLKVPAAKQRIVFDVPKGSRFENLNWKTGFFGATREEDTAWIGYRISDAVTGNPVLVGAFGQEWGGYVECSKPSDDLAIPLKPGTYNLEAVLRNTRDGSVTSQSNLWHIETKVTVKQGEDSVIVIR